MKSAIVTGASGFIGRALVRELSEHGIEAWAVARDPAKLDGLAKECGARPVQCRLEDIQSLDKKIPKGADAFFHLAWQGSSGAERGDCALQLENAKWTVDAVRAANKLGCSRFVGAGSIMEHEALAAAYAQGKQPGGGTFYSAAKLAAHIMSIFAARDAGIDLVWAEIINTYGPGEMSARMVNTTIRKCLRGEPPQFSSGAQNYDFTYIDDTARTLRLIGERGKPFHKYVIGSSAARPLREFLLEMQAAIAPELEFRFGDEPGIGLPLSYFDCSETEADTGFRASVPFGEGCRRTMEWLKAQGIT